MGAITDKMIVENAHLEEILQALRKHAEVNADIYISLSKAIRNDRGKRTRKITRKNLESLCKILKEQREAEA